MTPPAHLRGAFWIREHVALSFNDRERTLELGVHDLLEAGPAHGHLHLQAAWSARARMRAGQRVHAAHQADQAHADASYQAEVTVRHHVLVTGWEVTIRGRVDGLTVQGERLVVEEIKSSALSGERLQLLDLDDVPAWRRQLELYLHFVAAGSLGGGRADRTMVVGRLVLVSLVDGTQRVLHVDCPEEGAAWLHARLEWIIAQREATLAWWAKREQAEVPFPHPNFRQGQEQLVGALSEWIEQGRRVLLSAPTGAGKTAAVLTAALSVAYRTGRRVFFATARTTQQRIAEDTVRTMARQGMPVRAVVLRAREKVCLNEVVACRPDCCSYADGHHDRAREADTVGRLWDAAATLGVPSPDQVVAAAVDDHVCPFAIGLDMMARGDLVVGDYNYVFDPAVRLAALADAPEEWIVVVDEAHNLPDRAMGYGSSEIDFDLVRAVGLVFDAPENAASYASFGALVGDVGAWLQSGLCLLEEDQSEGAFALEEGLDRRWLAELTDRAEGLAMEYLSTRVHHPLVHDGPEGWDPWLDVVRALLRTRSACERAGEETVVIWRRGAGGAGILQLLCRDPSHLLAPLVGRLGGLICMSATLEPPEFYCDLMGLSDLDPVVHRVPSAFPPEHTEVLVVPTVSTEYRHRSRDAAETARLISECVAAVPGNVALYFSSFAYRDALAGLLDLGERPVLEQHPHMDEGERDELLAVMRQGQDHVLLGVLGGIFAEGIDLPGDALTAAVVVGPALPPTGLERRLIQAWYQERYGHGFRYAWMVPGMRRVVQAGGRVVRTPEDRGAVVLLGRRFLQRRFQELLPAHWMPERTGGPGAVLERFFAPERADKAGIPEVVGG